MCGLILMSSLVRDSVRMVNMLWLLGKTAVELKFTGSVVIEATCGPS
jgi:hypothetical protein